MTEQWICPQCQQSNPVEMRFCPHCGAANPTSAAPAPEPEAISPPPEPRNRRLLWTVAIALWLVGCAVLAVGGGYWLSRSDRNGEPVSVAAVEATPVVIVVTNTPAEELAPTETATVDATLAASAPTATSTSTVAAEVQSGDETEPLADAGSEEAEARSSDRLALPSATPTPAPEGVILFLSSRDHDPQTEAERKQLAQHRDLELYAMKPDGSEQIRLSDGNQKWSSEVAWLTAYDSPNRVVVNSQYVFDLTTMQVIEELTFGLASSGSMARFNYPVWSSKGEVIFFGGQGSASGNIQYLADAQAEPKNLTSPPPNVWGDGWPALSPDEEWITFLRYWDDPAQDGLWLMTVDGQEAHRIIDLATRRVFWSPDGRQLTFEGPKPNADTFSFEIWVSEADGSNPRPLTSLPDDISAWEPKWSPDGQRLVFEVQSSLANRQLFAVYVAGSEPEQLTTMGDLNIAPLWLPLDFDDLAQTIASLPPTPTLTPAPKPAAPPPPPVSSCPPGAQITSPAAGTKFTQRYNYILGIANIPQFHHWRIEYSTNPGSGGWSYLLERDYPVDNDKLIMLDASTVPRGPYGLRLTVVDVSGNYPEPCEIWFVNGY